MMQAEARLHRAGSPRSERPLRVFHLIKSLGRGGAEMLLAEGLPFADRERFEYGVGYFLPWKDALVRPLERHGVEVVCFEARSAAQMLDSVPAVARFLREWRADVVHCHLPLATIVGRFAGKMAGVRIVGTEHNLQERYHPFTRLANIASYPMQDHVIAVSAEVAASIGRNTVRPIPVQVVRNGVSVDRYQRDSEGAAQVRDRHRIPAVAPIVGTVAVFRAQKRLDLWLQMAAAVMAKRPDVHFLLVGDGPLRADVERWRAESRLVDRVHMPGLLEDVRPYLSAMNAYVMTSDFEGLPVALLEAMAAQVPPVVTAVGGIPEVVADGTQGLVAAPGDVATIVAAVIRLLDDPAMGVRMGAAARAHVERSFGMGRMMGEIESVYGRVFEHGQAR